MRGYDWSKFEKALACVTLQLQVNRMCVSVVSRLLMAKRAGAVSYLCPWFTIAMLVYGRVDGVRPRL